MKHIFIIIIRVFFIFSSSLCCTEYNSLPSTAHTKLYFHNTHQSNENYHELKTIRYNPLPYNEFSSVDYNFFSLINMSSTNLKYYFDTHHYKEKEILHCIPLYQSAEFITFIKTLDGYAATITALYKKYKNASRLKKFFWLLNNQYYKNFTKQLAKLNEEIKQQTTSDLIIKTLNNSDSYYNCSQQITAIICNALKKTNKKNALNDITPLINQCKNKLYKPNNEQQFVFNLAMLNHVLTDIQSTATHTSSPNNSPALFKQAIVTFITRLNPVTQISQWTDFIIDTAHFIADITIGKVYLSSCQYQARIDSFYNNCCLLSWDNLSHISAEQWINLGASLAADFVYTAGTTKIISYLKELNAIRTTQQQASNIKNSLRQALKSKLARYNFAITADETIIKQTPLTTRPISKKIPLDVKTCLEKIQTNVLQAVQIELPALRKKYDLTRKGFGSFAHKYIKINYEHILGMELFFKKGRVKIGGFHHDPMNIVEKSGIIEFSEKVMHKDGFYKARLLVNGKPAKHEASFFPAHWTREQVIDTILEAYDNFADNKITKSIENGKEILEMSELTKINIKIEFLITKTGKIITAYPKL